MAIANPARVPSPATYLVTAFTRHRRRLFLADAWAMLLLDTLLHYRSHRHFSLHQFVIMPDHIHLILTPAATLPNAMQVLQEGFSTRASNGLGAKIEVWQNGYTDHRISDAADYENWRNFIVMNPRRAGWIGEYRFSSATSAFALDAVPRALRPEAGGLAPQA